MWRSPRNVAAPAANEKQAAGTTQVVRRVEVTVERQVCSLEVHGVVNLQYGQACPVCGQTLAGPQSKSSLELGAGSAGEEKTR
jgi:hypothetical protein